MTEPDEKKKKFREPKEVVVIKNTYDWQRMKLDRLMKNPDKPVQLPEKSKEKKSNEPPDFVRNVMGSSAGAGSGEFHVYRHIRRREYSRQKAIQSMGEKERKDEEFRMKLESNQLEAEQKTAKKRAKRLRMKQLAKQKKKTKGSNPVDSPSESSSDGDSGAEDQTDPAGSKTEGSDASTVKEADS